MAMELRRFINIYIIFLGICIFFLYLGLKLLKRDPKDRQNQLISIYFLTMSFSLIINFIYGGIVDLSLHELVNFLNILTIYLICVAMGFLLISIILLYEPNKLPTKNQILFMVIYSIIAAIIFFIPNGVDVKILSDGTQLSPKWNLTFALAVLTILLTTMSFSIVLCVKTYKRFSNPILIKKMKAFLIGLVCYYYIAIGVTINNYLDVALYRDIFTYTNLILILGTWLLYYGIGTNVDTSQIINSKEDKKFKTNKEKSNLIQVEL